MTISSLIPNQWYAIEFAESVRRAPLGIRRMGLDLVLFRDETGAVACLRDRCPHKGVKLSLGKVENGRVVCGYHGFEFDGAGRCVRMPVAGRDARIPKVLCTPGYPVREKHGFVWMWWGDERPDDERPPIRIFPEFERHTATQSSRAWQSPIHYTRYMESLGEVYHVPFVHQGSRAEQVFNPATNVRITQMDVETDGNLIKSRFLWRDDSDRSDDEVLRDPRPWRRGYWVRNDLMLPNLAYVEAQIHGFGATMHIMAALAPIDEHSTWTMFRFGATGRHRLTRNPLFIKTLTHLSVLAEKYLSQPMDMRLLEGATPHVASLREEQHGAADRLIIEYLRARDRLLAEGGGPLDRFGQPRVVQ